MSSVKPLVFGAVQVALALAVALAFESVYTIEVRPRPPDPLASQTGAAQAGTEAAHRQTLSLRLVDSGGVGIPLAGEWGKDYSHDLRVFREVILEESPYVDASAFRRVDRQWRAYVERMREYGNNAIVIPLLLELIDFDHVNGAHGGHAMYDADSPFRARHKVVRHQFGPLLEWTNQQGMQLFLGTDMLALTPSLHQHLRDLAPDTSPVGIDTSDPAVWEVYRAGLEELFDQLPSIAGLVIRIGEGGSLYNTHGWPYRSELAVRDAASVQAMLRGLLPAFEARGKTLVLRTWTVGVGELGRLHVDPQVYQRVLGGIDSPALIVSTKFTAGDFFSYLPLNPTLASGRHRRLVELQARPEFEGFGAFPNFLGEEHAQALRSLVGANPRIVGTYLWPQFGGPLRAGPRSLYPLHGFWLWTDANVFVASRLALAPDADANGLVRQWAAATFGDDAQVVGAVTNVLAQTREAVRKGFYIRPFAEREVRVPGLELPPLMWIFEWDMVGGWHSLLSIVYRGSRDDVDVAIEEGDAAAGRVRRARQQLQQALAKAKSAEASRLRVASARLAAALRSLEYQETLFDVLAAWRQAFLSYYRWLETGEAGAWTQWTAGRERFEIAAARHVARFGGDVDFPAFDLTSATQAVTYATRGAWVRRTAAALLISVIALLGIGSPFGRTWGVSRRLGALGRLGRVTWTTTVTPWRLGREPRDLRSSMAVATLGLVLVGFLVGALTGFASAWIGASSLLVIGIVGLAFESTSIGLAGRQRHGYVFVAAVGPLIPGLIVLLAMIAYRGPLAFWYWFWIVPIFRVTVLTIMIAMLLWTAYAMLTARTSDAWRGRVGASLAAAGAGLLALTALLPNWVDVLRFLDRPLNLAPATETMLFALRTYAAVSLDAGRLPWMLGTLLLAAGYALSARGRGAERTHTS
ncbi:MAG: hypothetical protein GEU99_21040 [Luteitalea sp.]|nr:hypothetical protein [Luteitalea sp.]